MSLINFQREREVVYRLYIILFFKYLNIKCIQADNFFQERENEMICN